MRRALIACGMRPVSLAVDVTNYVMLELGQPLHAFDRAKLSGPLTVRRACAGGAAGDPRPRPAHARRRTTSSSPSRRGPLALAGTMGGLDSEIDESSHRVVIEAVHFSADAVARMSRRHRLSSEASRRFERGVDPRAAGGRVGAGRGAADRAGRRPLRRHHAGGRGRPVAAPSQMPADLPERVSGHADRSADRTIARLESVGADADRARAPTLIVTPPTWRPDLTDPADLVEEVVRLEGYENLPATLPRTRAGYGLTAAQRLRRRAGRHAGRRRAGRGPDLPVRRSARPGRPRHPADDPRSRGGRAGQPALRRGAVPAHHAAAGPGRHGPAPNLSRGAADVALFEIGLVFRGSDPGTSADPPRPSVSVGRLLRRAGRPRGPAAGSSPGMRPACWPASATAPAGGARGRPAVLVRRVASCVDLADELGVELRAGPGVDLAPWHPGRCASHLWSTARWSGTRASCIRGSSTAWACRARTVAFELHLDALLAAAAGRWHRRPSFSTMPVAKEDLALVVAAEVRGGVRAGAMLRGGGALLESVRLFDTYSGEQVGQGRMSLAFALRMRAPDRTLSADEVAEVRQRALADAEAQCGAELRT